MLRKKVQFFTDKVFSICWNVFGFYFMNVELDLEWGQVPVLEIDGVRKFQSFAIARFLARKYNLVGKNETEEYRCEEIVEAIRDFQASNFTATSNICSCFYFPSFFLFPLLFRDPTSVRSFFHWRHCRHRNCHKDNCRSWCSSSSWKIWKNSQ